MKNKICKICNDQILPKQNYCRLTEFKKGKILDEGFYHTVCYIQQIKHRNPEQVKARAMIMNLARRTDTIMKDAGY